MLPARSHDHIGEAAKPNNALDVYVEFSHADETGWALRQNLKLLGLLWAAEALDTHNIRVSNHLGLNGLPLG